MLNLLASKKESFRTEIRKQQHEQIFKEIRRRYQYKTIQKLTQLELMENLRLNFDYEKVGELAKLIENEHKMELRIEDSMNLLSQPFQQSLVILLQQILLHTIPEQFETIFENLQLGERLLNYFEQEKDMHTIDEILFCLGIISAKSILCQATLIKYNIIQKCLNFVATLEIEFDDYCMQSLMILLTTFVEQQSRTPFDELNRTLDLLNILCKKLRGINYLEGELEMNEDQTATTQYQEIKFSFLFRFLMVLKHYVIKSAYTTNLTRYKSVWIFVQKLAFEIQEKNNLRLTALQVFGEVSKGDQNIRFDIIEQHPDFLFLLLSILEIHQENNSINNVIRLQTSIIIKNIIQHESSYVIAHFYYNQIPSQLTYFVKQETNTQILCHQLDSIYFLLTHSGEEQSQTIYNQGLVEIILNGFKTMKDNNDFNLGNHIIQIISVVKNHEQAIKYLLENGLQNYLEFIISHCRNITITKKTEKLLQNIK